MSSSPNQTPQYLVFLYFSIRTFQSNAIFGQEIILMVFLVVGQFEFLCGAIKFIVTLLLCIVIHAPIPTGDNPPFSTITRTELPAKTSSMFPPKNILIVNTSTTISNFNNPINIFMLGLENPFGAYYEMPIVACYHNTIGKIKLFGFRNRCFLHANYASNHIDNGWCFSVIPYLDFSAKIHNSLIPLVTINKFRFFMYDLHENIRSFCGWKGIGTFLSSTCGDFCCFDGFPQAPSLNSHGNTLTHKDKSLNTGYNKKQLCIICDPLIWSILLILFGALMVYGFIFEFAFGKGSLIVGGVLILCSAICFVISFVLLGNDIFDWYWWRLL